MLKEAGAERVKEVQEGLRGGARTGVDSRPVCRWREDNTLEALSKEALKQEVFLTGLLWICAYWVEASPRRDCHVTDPCWVHIYLSP